MGRFPAEVLDLVALGTVADQMEDEHRARREAEERIRELERAELLLHAKESAKEDLDERLTLLQAELAEDREQGCRAGTLCSTVGFSWISFSWPTLAEDKTVVRKYFNV